MIRRDAWHREDTAKLKALVKICFQAEVKHGRMPYSIHWVKGNEGEMPTWSRGEGKGWVQCRSCPTNHVVPAWDEPQEGKQLKGWTGTATSSSSFQSHKRLKKLTRRMRAACAVGYQKLYPHSWLAYAREEMFHDVSSLPGAANVVFFEVRRAFLAGDAKGGSQLVVSRCKRLVLSVGV